MQNELEQDGPAPPAEAYQEPVEGAPYDVENESPNTLYQAWATGHLEPTATLRGLALRYREIEDDYTLIGGVREQVRRMISDVVAAMPQQRTTAVGFELVITGGGETVTWDTKQLDGVIAKLLASGYPDFAEMIAMARKTSTRAASLRITREKTK